MTLGIIAIAAIYCQLHGAVNGSVALSSLFESVLWGFYVFGGWLIVNPTAFWLKQGSIENLTKSFAWWHASVIKASFALVLSLLLGSYLYPHFDFSIATYQLLPIHIGVALVLKLVSWKSGTGSHEKNAHTTLDAITKNASQNQECNLEQKIKVLSGQGFAVISLNDISIVTGARNYLELTTNKGNYLLRNTMAEFQKKYTPAGFVRTHRSNIININHVKEIITDKHGNSLVQLINQQKVKLSNSYKPQFMKVAMTA